MIRRDATNSRGEPVWILISQVEHARVSAGLARPWGAGGVQPLDPRGALLATIEHHDDGWADWERRPEVDPTHGRPYDFMEMPLEQALPIWDRSISVARCEAGPLGGWLVASHFAALLRRGRAAHPHPVAYVELSDAWLARADEHRAGWLDDWQQSNPARHTAELANRGLAQLQMFDALSLWLCCAHRKAPKTVATPDGPRLLLTPVDTGAEQNQSVVDCGQQTITVAPWPFDVPVVELSAPGRLVAAEHYAGPAELAAAPSQVVRLSWVIKPAS